MNIGISSYLLDKQSGEADVQDAAIPVRRARSRRAIFLAWLRNIHLYVGLWGAALGLLFGVTGILLNHRSIMEIPAQKTVQKTVQMALPERVFSSAQEMSVWLQQELQFKPIAPPLIRFEPAKKSSGRNMNYNSRNAGQSV
jgi:hypothetical protein